MKNIVKIEKDGLMNRMGRIGEKDGYNVIYKTERGG